MASACEGGEPLILGGSDGVVFPLVHIESQVLGGILYFIGLMWCFQGVGIISDIFMSAIEKITSAKKRIPVTDSDRAWESIVGTTPSPTASQDTKSEPRLKTVKVWNDTVANLTLMALGSSAPEILLSVIELAPNKMKSGALGPATIVGSAAFNLLIITAVCVSAIPEGEERRIKDISVFAVTATFSVFAYLWLIVILVMWTPDVVTPIEGLLTIVFLPILVCLAYLADIGWFHKMLGSVKNKRLIFSHDTSVEDYHKMMDILKGKYPKMPDSKEAENLLLRYEFPENTTRAVRRMEATHGYSGQNQQLRDRHLHILGECVSKGLKPRAANDKVHGDSVLPAGDFGEADHKPNAIFEFVSDMYAVSESDKKVLLTVRRGGNDQTSASCKFRTVSGTAKKDEDYVHKQGQLDFLPAETEKTIEIAILEDKMHEFTEEFYVELVPVPGAGILGLKKFATVVVLDSDSPGELKFETDAFAMPEPSQRMKKEIKVERVGGCNGTLKCAYRTEDDSAKAGKDYEHISGELVFSLGVAHIFVEVAILPVASVDQRKETFRLIIEPCSDGPVARFDESTDGGSESGICTITIESDESGRKRHSACLTASAASQLANRGVVNLDNVQIGTTRWKAQFLEAIYVGGDRESQADAGVVDWTFHIISVPWKVFFAAVPPTDFCEGKLTFACALFMIGICTAFIGDLANLLGCALEIPPEICAITFVALGTSLPDTFASKTAAVQDPTADNSIGNVTGSNSVNVFLGLGLSWSAAAIYWEFKGEEFQVNAGSLGPSVAVFCGCAVSCIGLLLVRRWTLGAELGGPVLVARMSSAFLVLLWIVYIVSAVLMVED